MGPRNSTFSSVAAVAAALLLGACGGLDSPDLSTGEVSGRLTGAVKTGAFAYALGAPQTKAAIGADGSYTLRGVPVTASASVQVVLFDGGDRADVQVAPVRPASRSRADDRDASTLARAATVRAAVRCSGGASGRNATYAAQGTALATDPRGEVAELFPLPAGTFNVRAALSGFRENGKDVAVASGETAEVELELELDDDDSSKGCIANGCLPDRECDEDDGRCYACTTDAECEAGRVCESHVCVSGSGRPMCAPCASSQDCAPNGSAGLCVADPSGTGTVCSVGCAGPSDCPSGFACLPVAGGGSACLAPSGCAAYFDEFGTPCLRDDDCALALPRCVKPGGATLGQCSAECASGADCPATLGYVCSDKVCVKP